jgi:hypothetical protein
MAVLDDLERNLVLDLVDAEAGRGLVLDDEALDLVECARSWKPRSRPLLRNTGWRTLFPSNYCRL